LEQEISPPGDKCERMRAGGDDLKRAKAPPGRRRIATAPDALVSEPEHMRIVILLLFLVLIDVKERALRNCTLYLFILHSARTSAK
jgi:hypothetical protein